MKKSFLLAGLATMMSFFAVAQEGFYIQPSLTLRSASLTRVDVGMAGLEVASGQGLKPTLEIGVMVDDQACLAIAPTAQYLFNYVAHTDNNGNSYTGRMTMLNIGATGLIKILRPLYTGPFSQLEFFGGPSMMKPGAVERRENGKDLETWYYRVGLGGEFGGQIVFPFGESSMGMALGGRGRFIRYTVDALKSPDDAKSEFKSSSLEVYLALRFGGMVKQG